MNVEGIAPPLVVLLPVLDELDEDVALEEDEPVLDEEDTKEEELEDDEDETLLELEVTELELEVAVLAFPDSAAYPPTAIITMIMTTIAILAILLIA